MYAKAFFEKMQFDSITLSPYMGQDSVTEFLKYDDKYAIILALTSNQGANDFQIPNDLFLDVISKSQKWNNSQKLMYVVGATKSDYLLKIREIVKDNFLLIPGIGAQGGNLQQTIKNSTKYNKRILINVSRTIIYANNDINYLDSAEMVVDDFNLKTF